MDPELQESETFPNPELQITAHHASYDRAYFDSKARWRVLKLMLVFLGGGLGSVGRYSVGMLVARWTPTDLEPPHWMNLYPLATMLVNLIGCAVIGGAWAWVLTREQGQQSPMMVFLIVGVLGGFTTFSSFGWETLELIQNQRLAMAAVYVVLSLTLGLLGVLGGYTVGTAMFASGSHGAIQ